MLKRFASRLDTLYPDGEARRRARALWLVLLIAGAGSLLYFVSLLPGLLQRTTPTPLNAVIASVTALVVIVGCFPVLFNGRQVVGAWLLSAGLWVASMIALAPVGVLDLAAIILPLLVVLSGFALGWQETLVVTGLYIAGVVGMAVLQLNGTYPLPPIPPGQNVLAGLGTILTATALTGVFAALLSRQLSLTAAEAEAQAQKLRATVEVGKLITSILNPDEMLRAVVERIREEFGYYHVQVYLLDERGSRMALQASTGLAGRDLLARGHSLQVGSGSLVGQATVRREPVVIEEIEEEKRETGLLPDTRSEAALPIATGTRLVGVLDVHSTQPRAFTEEIVGALHTLASQMATAIESAQAAVSEDRLLETTSPVFRASREIALANDPVTIIETLRRHVSGNLDRISIVRVGFGPGGEPAPEVMATWDRANVALQAPFPEEVRRLVGSQQIIIPDTSLISPEQTTLRNYAEITLLAGSIAVFPLAGRDRTAGYLVFASRATRVYSEREVQVFRILADQIAIVLENLLLLDTLSRRTEQLANLNQMAQVMTGTLDVGELGQAVLATLESVAPVAHLSIALYDPNRPWAHLGVMRGAAEGDEPSRELKLEGTLIEQALHTGASVVVHDAGGRHQGVTWIIEKTPTVLVIPLRAHDEYLGTLNIGVNQTEPLDYEAVSLCEQVATQFAIALDNVRLFEQLENSLEEARMLYHTSLAINSAHSADEVCSVLLSQVAQISQAKQALVYLAGPDPRSRLEYLEETARWSDGEVIIPPIPERHDKEAVPGLSPFLRTQGNLVFESVAHDSRLSGEARQYYEARGVSGLAVIPLNMGATWLGALLIELTDGQSLSSTQLRLCRSIADQAALVIDSQLLLARTQRIAAREQALREITNRLRSAPDAETVLRIAVEELSQALDAPKGAALVGRRLSGKPEDDDGQSNQG